MLVICDGMPRSASTWSYNVVLALLGAGRPSAYVYGAYDEDVAHFLESAPSTAAHAVVKCHRLDRHARGLLRAGDAMAIYTWRDPADAVVSCMCMFGYDFERSLSVIELSLELYQLHRHSPTALTLSYEEIIHDSVNAIRRIATILHVDAGEEIVDAVDRLTSLGRMKSHADSLADIATKGEGSLKYDPRTLLHHRHIRHGGIGYGRSALTLEQAAQIDDLLARHGLAIPAQRPTAPAPGASAS